MTEDWVSVREMGRRIERTHGAVQKAIKDGRIPVGSVRRGSDGNVEAVEYNTARKAWEENTDQDQALRTLASSSAAAAGVAGSSPATPPQGTGDQLRLEPDDESKRENAGSPGSTAQAQKGERAAYIAKRTEREDVNLELARLELAKEAGALVAVEDQRRESFAIWRSARDKLRTIPDRVADMLAAETDAGKVRTTLLKEIDQVLNGLSDFARAEAAGGAGERASG